MEGEEHELLDELVDEQSMVIAIDSMNDESPVNEFEFRISNLELDEELSTAMVCTDGTMECKEIRSHGGRGT